MATPSTPTAYGVWIDGTGWLRNGAEGKTFAALDRAVAESAAALWGAGSRVLPFDESLVELQGVFLAQQAKQAELVKKAWWQWPTLKR